MDKYTTEELKELKKIIEEFIEDCTVFAENLATIKPILALSDGDDLQVKDGLFHDLSINEFIDDIDNIQNEIDRRGDK